MIPAVLELGVLPLPAAAQRTMVTETIRLTYGWPSEVIRTLRQDILDPSVPEPKSEIPAEIVQISHDEAKKTITVRGRPEAITNLKAMVRLMDVKPRVLEVKTRLIEVRLTKDGTRKETLVQTPVTVTKNNVPARVSIAAPLRNSMTFRVTPQLNGDGSISVNAELGVRHTTPDPIAERIHTSTFTSSLRLTGPSEWQALREVSVKDDERLQKATLLKKDPPAEIYPLYRWEVSAAERSGTSRL